jgi:hypothetical protein
MTVEVKTMVQIAPATPGWWAVMDLGEAEPVWFPVALWALLESVDGYRFIDGVDPTGEGWEGMTTCSEVSGFIDFRYDPDRKPA